MTGRYAAPLGLMVAIVLYGQAATEAIPLGALDPTARMGGWRDLTAQVDRLARAENASFLLVSGYPETSLLTYYGDPALPVAQDGERDRWLFEKTPPDALFATPGLAFSLAGRRFDAELSRHFRQVDEVTRLDWRRGDYVIASYIVYRVADAIPPVMSSMSARR